MPKKKRLSTKSSSAEEKLSNLTQSTQTAASSANGTGSAKENAALNETLFCLFANRMGINLTKDSGTTSERNSERREGHGREECPASSAASTHGQLSQTQQVRGFKETVNKDKAVKIEKQRQRQQQQQQLEKSSSQMVPIVPDKCGSSTSKLPLKMARSGSACHVQANKNTKVSKNTSCLDTSKSMESKSNKVDAACSTDSCIKSICNSCHCESCKIYEQRVEHANLAASNLLAEEERKKKRLDKKKMQKKKRKQQKKDAVAEEKKMVMEEETDPGEERRAANNNWRRDGKPKKETVETHKQMEGNSIKVEQSDPGGEESKMKSRSAKKKKKWKAKDREWMEEERKADGRKEPGKSSGFLSSSSSDEEELNMNSAFVADIALRKTKTSAILNKSPFLETPYVIDLTSWDSGDLSDSQESYHSTTKDNAPHAGKARTTTNTAAATAANARNVPTANTTAANRSPKSTDRDKNTKADSSDIELNQRLVNSIEVGSRANELALSEEYAKAIDLFTAAIKLNPKDYRFYVNRSYCYDCLMEYELALQDAETAISLNPKWPKCYYRKGRAYAGLKRFEEAEEAFRKVVDLEGQSCNEARTELANVRLGALLQLGYDEKVACAAAKKYTSVREAIYSVVNGHVNTPLRFNPVVGSTQDGYSSDDYDDFSNLHSNHPGLSQERSSDVTNPFGWKALWVGNLSPDAKQYTIQKMFEKFGHLSHCGLYKRPEGAFALVHFDNAESPRRAMAEYQGAVVKSISLNGTEKMILRFRPNKDQKKQKYQERLDIAECYYWRTTGCQRADECHYMHIPANKGVDIQPWMLNSQKKPTLKQ